MKKPLFILLLLLQVVFYANAQNLKYTASRDGWIADSLGNQRAVITFSGSTKLAKVSIDWRRSDPNPEEKAIIVQDAKTGKLMDRVYPLSITKEKGVFCFEAEAGPGTYYIYYQPYKNEGRSNYPKGTYLKQKKGADAKENLQSLAVNTKVVEIQAVNAFNSVYPMEVIATADEVRKLKAKHAEPAYLVFPESRNYPIIMQNDIPQRWIINGAQKSFTDKALRGENFSFQLGIYALKELQNVSLKFSDLKDASGNRISAKLISCLNTNGIAYDGSPLVKKVDVPQNKVQALWNLLTNSNINKARKLYRYMLSISVAKRPYSQVYQRLTLQVDPQIA
jgi:hypothetical protein